MVTYIITHIIGLKPKTYCYKVYGDQKDRKKSKGVVKHKVSNQLSYKTYEKTLNRNCGDKISFNIIRSKNNQIYRINQIKYRFSSCDNKRYWDSDFESLPFEHHAITYFHNENDLIYMYIYIYL